MRIWVLLFGLYLAVGLVDGGGWSVRSVTGSGGKCVDAGGMPGYSTYDYGQVLVAGDTVSVTTCGYGGSAEVVLETSAFMAGVDDPISFEAWIPVISGSQVYAGVDGGSWRQVGGPTWYKGGGECVKDDMTFPGSVESQPVFVKYTYPSGRWEDGKPHTFMIRVVKGDDECHNQVVVRNLGYSAETGEEDFGLEGVGDGPDVGFPGDAGELVDGVSGQLKRFLKGFSKPENSSYRGMIVFSSGRVVVERGLDDFNGRQGDRLYTGDIVSVSGGGLAILDIEGVGEVNITGGGRFNVPGKKSRVDVNFLARVYNWLSDLLKGESFEIRTPTCSLGVRG